MLHDLICIDPREVTIRTGRSPTALNLLPNAVSRFCVVVSKMFFQLKGVPEKLPFALPNGTDKDSHHHSLVQPFAEFAPSQSTLTLV